MGYFKACTIYLLDLYFVRVDRWQKALLLATSLMCVDRDLGNEDRKTERKTETETETERRNETERRLPQVDTERQALIT